MDTADTGQDTPEVTDDFESRFVKSIEQQMEGLPDTTEDPPEEEETEAEESEEDETEDETEGEDDTEAEESDEDEDKISLRINGKKAGIEDVLERTVHTVKVDGEELEVDYSELKNGYQRGKDYANKTTELKQLKEEIRPYSELVAFAKSDPQFVEMVTNYVKNGPQAVENPLLSITDTQLSGLLDSESDTYDPDKAGKVIKARTEWNAKSQERQSIQKRVQAEQIQAHNEWAQQEIEKARSVINELGGEDAYDKDGPDVIAHLAEAGFSQEEISTLVDSRLTVIAWEAAQYRKMKDSTEAPRVRLGQKRKNLTPPKAAPAGQGKPKISQSKRQRDTYRKAQTTQREDDWLSAIEQRLKF